MIQKTLFSIIIPCYNVEQYVDEAIQSCLRQKNINDKEFEIIAINDGSKDATLQKLQQYSNHVNITIISQDNLGLSATRNRGVKIAKGEYILFLDGDDWFSPNALYTLKQNLGNADLVIFPMEFYFSETNRKNESLRLINGHIYTSKELLHETIGKSQFQSCPAPTKCYKTSLFQKNGLQFISGILHEDGPFYLEVLYNVSTIKYVEEYIYHYRQQRIGSITTRKRTWRNAEGIFKGNERIFSLYGYKNKDVNYYFLATSVMQLFQSYENEIDVKMVVKYMSTTSYRKFMLHLLLHSRFHIRTLFLGLMVLISPEISRKIYSNMH